MQARNDFSIKGLNELMKAYKNLPKQMEESLRAATDKGGEILLNNTRQEAAPYNRYSKTGKLVKSLYIKRAPHRNHTYTPVLTWGDDVREYAAPLELGHHLVFFGKDTPVRIPAKPFLRPGADKSGEQMISLQKQAANKTFDEMGGLKNGQF